MNVLGGLVLRSYTPHETVAFYEALLGVVSQESKHENGSVHAEVTHFSAASVLEIYAAKLRHLNEDALIINVVSLDTAVALVVKHTGDIVSVTPGKLAYVRDPDGRLILLLPM